MNSISARFKTAIGIILIFLFFFLFVKPIYFSILLGLILVEILFFEWSKIISPKKLEFWLITPFYPILPFIILIFMNQQYNSLVFLLFVLVFTFDTGSYLIGKNFGKTKVNEKISPGKTWEGFLGGYLSVCLVMYLSNLFFTLFPLNYIFSFPLVLGTLALSGDLFESYFKRAAGIKDSGKILPGHGGFLDRFDSVLFVIFLFYFLRNNLINYVN